MKLITAATLAALTTAGTAEAATLFTLDNTNNFSLSHTSSTQNQSPPKSGSLNVGNGTFSWGNLETDGSANTASVTAGKFASTDWGGLGMFTSSSINVTMFDSIDIDGIYSGTFNTNTEFSNFFYSLDGGSMVDFGAGVVNASANNVGVGIMGLDVSSASSLVVGFEYNHNGSSDSFGVSELTVEGEPVPPNTDPMFDMGVFSFMQTVGDSDAFEITATDPDAGDTLTFMTDGSEPDFIDFLADGTFSSTPGFTDAGDYSFGVTVGDGNGGFGSATVNLTVAIPEPLSAGALGLLGLVGLRRRRA